MAATEAYVGISRIRYDGGAVDESEVFSNVGATTAAFALRGGLYGISCHASTYGTVTLQVLAGDGSTWLTAATAFSADGYETAYLMPGSYRVALA